MSLGCLPKELISEIGTHLSPCDAYSLKLTNKLAATAISIEQILIKRINTRLNSILGVECWNKVKIQMERVGAVISGSILIQVFLDQDWETDVDIIVPWERVSYSVICHKRISDFDDFLYQTLEHGAVNYNSTQTYNDGREELISIRNYSLLNSKTSIQTVIVKSDERTMDEFVYQHADFDICRNVFGIVNQKEYVKMCSVNEIHGRSTPFKLGKVVSNSMKRRDKYVSRGFEFTGDLESLFEQIISKSSHYKVFEIEKIEFNRYRLVKGDVKALDELTVGDIVCDDQGNQISVEQLKIDDNILEFSAYEHSYGARDENIICPVKFCYGSKNCNKSPINDESPVTTQFHFHIEGIYQFFGPSNDFIFMVQN